MHTVFVGFRCNGRCGFCAQGDLRDRELSDCVSEDLAALTAGSVVAFTGGEPTLHDALPAWIRRAREGGAAEVVVQTNGQRLAEPGHAAALAKAGAARLDVSLHGSTAAMHDFHTGVPGSFEATTSGIREATRVGLAVGVTTVVTRSNFRHLSDIVRAAASLGASAVHFTVVQPLGRARRAGASLAPAGALLKPHWTEAIQTARALGVHCFAAGAVADASLGARWFPGLGVVDAPVPADQ